MKDGRDKSVESTRTAPDSARMLALGTVLAGRYRIDALAGVGGMGMVYRAHDMQLNLDVAVKVMRPEWLAEQQMLERFRRELVLARQVSHRNVVRIHDIGADGERLFLTMDYIDGRPLNDVLAAEGPLPAGRAANIAAQLAEALAAAHAEGVIHRDLKPGNVLVASGDRAFITDFGIARSVAATGLTQVGQVLGTPDYLSPEQARGGEVDGRSDIYALGLILYRMLTGELPFSGGSYEEVLAQHTTGHTRDISQTGIGVPRWLRQVIRRCLERDPADRYASAADLANDLRRGRAGWSLRRGAIRAAAVLLIAALGIAVFLQRFTPGPAGDGEVMAVDDTPRHTLAVLPLKRDGDADAWMAAGLVESLAAQLAESPDLQVVEPGRLARTLQDLEIDAAALSERDIRQLAELLDIDRLLTGSVTGAGNALRIRIQLEDARRTGVQSIVLNEDVAGRAEWFTAVDRLSERLRGALAAKPALHRAGRLTHSVEAMEAFTRGLAALRSGDSIAAAPLLEEAVAADPDSAAALLRLSEAYAQLGRDDEALDTARRAVAAADAANGRLAFEARAREAALSGRHDEAERTLRELLDAYPHDIETRIALGEIIGESGRFEAAITELLAAAAEDANHPRAWYLLGKYSILNGDSQRAVDDYLVRALVIHNKLDNDQGRADAFNAFGIAHHQLGNLQRAREYYAQAAELRERIGDTRGLAAAIANVARVQVVEGDYEGARAQFDAALATLDALGDRRGAADMHNELGILEEERGDYVAALAHYRSALKNREGLGDRRAVAESRNNVGYAYYLLGEYDNASVYAEQALRGYEETANPDGVMLARQTIGLIEIARGNWNAALKALLEALDIARQIDFPHAAAVSHGNIGLVAQLQGRYQAAADSYDQAVAIMTSVGDPRGVAEFTLHRAALDLELGQVDAADARLAKAASALETAGNIEQAAWLAALRARSLLLKGETRESLAAFHAALDASRDSGSELAQLRVATGFVEALLANDRITTALETLSSWRERADALGHAASRLRLRLVEAEAAMLAGDNARALARVEEAQRLLRTTGDYAWSWRIHGIASRLLDTDEAVADAAAREQAERERVRENMNEAQRAAFDLLYPGEALLADGTD